MMEELTIFYMLGGYLVFFIGIGMLVVTLSKRQRKKIEHQEKEVIETGEKYQLVKILKTKPTRYEIYRRFPFGVYSYFVDAHLTLSKANKIFNKLEEK